MPRFMTRSLAISLLAMASAASAQTDGDLLDLATASAQPALATAAKPPVVRTSAAPAVEAPAVQRAPHGLSAQLLRVDYGGSVAGGAALANGVDVGYHHRLGDHLSLGIPLKFGVVERDAEFADRSPFASADLTAQVGYPLLDRKVTPYAVAGGGVVYEPEAGTNVQVPMGAGVRVRVADATYLTTQFEFRKSLADGRDNSQVGLGLLFDLGAAEFEPRNWDSDGDGVSDADDECPSLAGAIALAGCPDSDGDGFGDAVDPCPLYYGKASEGGCPDSDRDGVPDPEDACPDLRGVASERGCPLPDADGDGVGDAADRCPAIPGTLNGCPDADADGVPDELDGCPEVAGPRSTAGCPDRDDDGLPDDEDPCPELAGTTDGCPDRDRDGVYDAEDRCPNVAGDPASGGCPEIMSLERGGHAGAIPDIRFGEGATSLDSLAVARLDRLAGILTRYPSYTLEITGHADFEEPVRDRTDLSGQRALACRDYLVGRGVGAARISTDGFGAGKPIVRQGTAVERERNRRVEFDMITE